MHRRTFVAAAASVTGGIGRSSPYESAAAPTTGTVGDWRAAFPALDQRINGHPLVYLDSAATTLRPLPVIEAIANFYRGPNANPSASLHTLARQASAALEGARATVAGFIGATDPLEIVFTRGTTEAINLVAATWGAANVRPGDEILIGVAEHASNMLPWRSLARASGAQLAYFGIDEHGSPHLDDLAAKLTPQTRVVAFSQVSNVLGTINPAREMIALTRGPGRIVVVDAAQSVPHLPVDVGDLGCDFLAFSGHKVLGPMGLGVLWGRRQLLDQMPPYQWGSNMAHDADLDGEHLAEGALKYGAGTPNVSGPVGLAAALDFIRKIGHDTIVEHEQLINGRMMERLAQFPRVRLLGVADPTRRIGVFSFGVKGIAPNALAKALDTEGVAIRAGDLASLPLLQHFGLSAAARASCYIYTTEAGVDRFAEVLGRAIS